MKAKLNLVECKFTKGRFPMLLRIVIDKEIINKWWKRNEVISK